MSIIIVAAMGRKDRVIGNKGELPWDAIPEDMKHFRKLTLFQTVLMGRKTWESIGSRPLLSRKENIVLTRDEKFVAEGATVMHDCDSVLQLSRTRTIFVIGGAEIYSMLIPFAEFMFITQVHGDFSGDTYFPCVDLFAWKIVNCQIYLKSETNPYYLKVRTFERLRA